MLIVNVISILIGLVLWFVPRVPVRSHGYVASTRRPPKVALRGGRKQVVAGLYIAAGLIGIVAGLHENVIFSAGVAFWIVAVILANPVPGVPATPTKRTPSAHFQRTMNEFGRTTDQIYSFLSQPENAAIKARVMSDVTDRFVGETLVKAMNLPTTYGRDFFECMQSAIARIKQDEQNRPASPKPTGPTPEFDVVLIDPGQSTIQVIKVVKQLTKLDLKETQDLVSSVPATILESVSQDQAELVQDALHDLGATVELIATEAK